DLGPAEPSPDKSSPSPSYMLALSRKNKESPVPEKTPALNHQKSNKPQRHWAVQVASLADKKDAEVMVRGLKANGYEAYIVPFEKEGKTWHRVRVGELSELKAANELQQSLANQPSFKQAYVVVYY
ncbi:MAG TPA: SPOR domain-containing protein, partial [Terriglobales bacterium]|nr:SPOR domain-containing protein [Terriglobales bacterium]